MDPPTPKNLSMTRLCRGHLLNNFTFLRVGHRCLRIATSDCIKRGCTLDATHANHASSGFVVVCINLSYEIKSIFVRDVYFVISRRVSSKVLMHYTITGFHCFTFFFFSRGIFPIALLVFCLLWNPFSIFWYAQLGTP